MATGAEVIHTFERPGRYAVVLDATDGGDCLSRAALGLTVLP